MVHNAGQCVPGGGPSLDPDYGEWDDLGHPSRLRNQGSVNEPAIVRPVLLSISRMVVSNR